MLKVNGIVVYYGAALILQSVSIEIKEADVISIIGPNGAGKTTLIKAIMGLVPIVSGEIYFQDEQINKLPTHKIVEMGLANVPEGRGIFKVLTVRENLILGASSKRAKRLLRQSYELVFGLFSWLEGRLNQPAGTLSGGEQQMLAIGRALMAAPKLLLVDEMSMGLAPVIVRDIAQKIIEISGKGIGVGFIEQNAKVALELSRFTYLMNMGRIALKGEAKEMAKDETVKNLYLGGM
jgi:branched-chain amino acid transport system ATP-binding protein